MPFDARALAHGDFRPPPSRVVGASQLPWLRLFRQSKPRHRAGFTCSGLGSVRRPLSPSADFCAPIGLPLDSPSTRQAHRAPRVRRVTFLPHPPHIHHTVPDDIGLRKPTLPRPTAQCLTCDSCTSGQKFAYSFLQIPPRGGHPCCSARSSCHQGLQGTFTLTSLPGRLSPSGCQRQSRRCAPCLAHVG